MLGWERIASWSVTPLTWDYKPKRHGANRFSLIVDANIETEVIPIPMESWCVTLVAVERGRRDLIEAALEHYRSKELLIAHLIAECAHVNIVGVLWTMAIETWNAVHASIERERHARGKRSS